MRCFISIDIDDKLLPKIADVQEKIHGLNSNVKLVNSKNMHFTVKFIGNVNENEICEMKKILLHSSQKLREFKIYISGVGFFGSSSHIRTIWLGINKGRKEMENLMNIVNNDIMGEYKILPHITIARVKSKMTKNELTKLFSRADDVNIGEMNVKFISFKSSILTSDGPIYTDLAKYRIGDKI